MYGSDIGGLTWPGLAWPAIRRMATVSNANGRKQRARWSAASAARSARSAQRPARSREVARGEGPKRETRNRTTRLPCRRASQSTRTRTRGSADSNAVPGGRARAEPAAPLQIRSAPHAGLRGRPRHQGLGRDILGTPSWRGAASSAARPGRLWTTSLTLTTTHDFHDSTGRPIRRCRRRRCSWLNGLDIEDLGAHGGDETRRVHTSAAFPLHIGRPTRYSKLAQWAGCPTPDTVCLESRLPEAGSTSAGPNTRNSNRRRYSALLPWLIMSNIREYID